MLVTPSPEMARPLGTPSVCGPRLFAVVVVAGAGCAPVPANAPPATPQAPPAVAAPSPAVDQQPPAPYEGFITRQADKLMAGDRPFRFISFNIPNLHYVEDNLPFEGTNPWRLPNAFEIEDAIASVAQMGGQVVRTYTLSVHRQPDAADTPRHVLGPGEFNEEAFRVLDKVVEIASKYHIRLIVPFVDNWRWWGGINEYAAFRGKQSPPGASEDVSAFWTDRELIEDYKKTVSFVLNRKNIFTGVTYKDDPTILAWEPVNEPRDPYAWTREIADYLKQVDPKHLVIDGYHSRGDYPPLRESLNDPNVDIVSTHHYPSALKRLSSGIQQIAAQARGKKPYIIGEFGFAPLQEMSEVLDTVISEGATGALAWSLRFHNRDGGFYWHSEGAGPGIKAYHWPGFASGAAYEETQLLALMRAKAYEIQGYAPPPLPAPLPPLLLPVTDVASLRWQGSTGAHAYRLERAATPDGPWQVVSDDISDAATQYRPLFNDDTAPVGAAAYYRVSAVNSTGVSAPSNIVGPVEVPHRTLVDELMDASRLSAKSDAATFESQDARRMKEDAHRLALPKDASVTYQVPGTLKGLRFDFFFPDAKANVTVEVSTDGKRFRPLKATVSRFSPPDSPYGFWIPTRFEASLGKVVASTVRVTAAAAGELARVELSYAPAPDEQK